MEGAVVRWQSETDFDIVMNESLSIRTAAMDAKTIIERMRKQGAVERARVSQSFFKTGPGEYGEGDVFFGLTVPQVRALAKEFRALPESETLKLLHSPVHEARLLALLILIGAYAKGTEAARERIYGLYLKNTRWINNWDLVDCSAEHIVGAHLWTRDRSVLEAPPCRRCFGSAGSPFWRRSTLSAAANSATRCALPNGSWATARI